MELVPANACSSTGSKQKLKESACAELAHALWPKVCVLLLVGQLLGVHGIVLLREGTEYASQCFQNCL